VEHVDEDDDGRDVVECKEKHPDGLYDTRRVTAARKHAMVTTVASLARVLDLDAVDADQTKHGPEQTEQCTRQPATHPRHRHRHAQTEY